MAANFFRELDGKVTKYSIHFEGPRVSNTRQCSWENLLHIEEGSPQIYRCILIANVFADLRTVPPSRVTPDFAIPG